MVLTQLMDELFRINQVEQTRVNPRDNRWTDDRLRRAKNYIFDTACKSYNFANEMLNKHRFQTRVEFKL